MSEIKKRNHPGVFIRKSLESWSMTAKEFAFRTGISERTLSDLLNEKGSITFDIASNLAAYFDNDVQFWMNLQTQYNIYISQLQEEEAINEDYKLIKGMISYLKTILTIEDADSHETIVKKVRSTIGVNRLTSLNQRNSFVSLKETHGSDIGNHYFEKNLWISLSLKLSRDNKVEKFNKTKLYNSLDEIRNMTTQNPNVFYPRLKELLGDCGISFVLLPYLPKSNIYGATKWLNSDTVMLAMSNKGNRADVFWFTLFHELAHVTYEHKRYLLIHSEEIEDKEADSFAKNYLINENDWNNFVNSKIYTEKSIIDFAKKINILPYIVLGRLHKENIINYGVLDKTLAVNYKINY